MEEEKNKRHKCWRCGCRIFKVEYAEDGIIFVYCNQCDCMALVLPPIITSIPIKDFYVSEEKQEGEQ